MEHEVTRLYKIVEELSYVAEMLRAESSNTEEVKKVLLACETSLPLVTTAVFHKLGVDRSCNHKWTTKHSASLHNLQESSRTCEICGMSKTYFDWRHK